METSTSTECLRIGRTGGTPDAPFPTLKIAAMVDKLFHIEPTPTMPLKMLSSTDFVAFPNIKSQSGDMLWYYGQEGKGESLRCTSILRPAQQLREAIAGLGEVGVYTPDDSRVAKSPKVCRKA